MEHNVIPGRHLTHRKSVTAVYVVSTHIRWPKLFGLLYVVTKVGSFLYVQTT